MHDFEAMLSGGHPNSLGRTVEVVEAVLADQDRLGALLDCYASDDPVVRLRASNALKRIEAERHDWLIPCIDRLIDGVGTLDQPSAQWTLAQLFGRLAKDMTADQRRSVEELLRRNLAQSTDWIVLNTTLDTLAEWARDDTALRDWLRPHAERLSLDGRKSVAARATKILKRLR
jgi:hypothetical protein